MKHEEIDHSWKAVRKEEGAAGTEAEVRLCKPRLGVCPLSWGPQKGFENFEIR